MISVLKDAITIDSIKRDMLFAGRYINSCDTAPREATGIFSLCIFCYFSLFVSEASRQMGRIDPASAAQLSPQARSILNRSRNSLKLFDDKERGKIDGVIDYLANEVRVSQRVTFGGSKFFPLARLWAKDLGLFSYDGHTVLSTDAAVFTGGLDPKDRVTSRTFGPRFRDISAEYGAYMAAWGVRRENAQSFANQINADKIETRDVKGNEYFAHAFNGATTPKLNMALSLFQVMMSFNEHILTLDRTPVSQPTIFRIRFLLSYEVWHSLNGLLRRGDTSLLPQMKSRIDAVLNSTDSALFQVRGFRNDLMHYCPDASIPDASLSQDSDALFGLSEHYYSGASLDDLKRQLNVWTSNATDLLEGCEN